MLNPQLPVEFDLFVYVSMNMKRSIQTGNDLVRFPQCRSLRTIYLSGTSLLILLLLSLIIFSSCSDEPVVVRTKFLPQKTYETKLIGKTKSVIEISGDQDRLSQLRASGIELPMTVSSENQMDLVIRTGHQAGDGGFPATVMYKSGYTKMSSKGNDQLEPSPISGMVVKGRYNSNNQFEVDTIVNKRFDQSMKQQVKSSLENVGNAIPFPEEPMNVGDSFSQSFPITFPALSGFTAVDFPILSIYTVTDIEKERVKFSIDQSVNIDSLVNGNYISAIGNGLGEAVYSITENFLTEHRYDLEMNINLSVNNLLIDAQTELSSSQKVNIESTSQ